jgi:phosphoribosylanthranilate isomerase
MTRVKICGITNLADALAAVDAGADALGFVLAEEAKVRKRYISLDDAIEIIEQLPPFVTTVAVTVNEPIGKLVQYMTYFDLVQLHGEEQPGHLPMGHLAIKAFRVGPDFKIGEMEDHRVRAWLLDAFVPDQRGGTGMVCDWEVAEMAASMSRPLILAGGLTPENVGEAIYRVHPFGVDVSGGVEAEPGKKDHERIRQFIDNVREASLA